MIQELEQTTTESILKYYIPVSFNEDELFSIQSNLDKKFTILHQQHNDINFNRNCYYIKCDITINNDNKQMNNIYKLFKNFYLINDKYFYTRICNKVKTDDTKQMLNIYKLSKYFYLINDKYNTNKFYLFNDFNIVLEYLKNY